MFELNAPSEGVYSKPSELIAFVSEKFSAEIDNGKLDILLGSKKNCPSDDRYLEGLPKVKRIVSEILSSSLSSTTRRGVVSCAIYRKTPTDDRCRYFREADRFYIFCIDVRISQASVDYRTWNDIFNLFQRNLLLWNDDLKYLGGGMRYNRQRGDDGRMCSLINLSMPLRSESDVIEFMKPPMKRTDITQLPTLRGPPLDISHREEDFSIRTYSATESKSTATESSTMKSMGTLSNNVVIGGGITDAQATAMVPEPLPLEMPAPLTAAAIIAAVERAATAGGAKNNDSSSALAGLLRNAASAAISRLSGPNSVIGSLQGTRRNSFNQQQQQSAVQNNENLQRGVIVGLEKSATYDLNNNSTPGTGATPQRGELSATSPVSTRRLGAIDENKKSCPAVDVNEMITTERDVKSHHSSSRRIAGTADAAAGALTTASSKSPTNHSNNKNNNNKAAAPGGSKSPPGSSIASPSSSSGSKSSLSWGNSLLSMIGLSKKPISPMPIIPNGGGDGSSPKPQQRSMRMALGSISRPFLSKQNSVVPSPVPKQQGGESSSFRSKNKNRNSNDPHPQHQQQQQQNGGVDDALLKAKSDLSTISGPAGSLATAARNDSKSRWQDFFSGSLRITSSVAGATQQTAAAPAASSSSSSGGVAGMGTMTDKRRDSKLSSRKSSKLGGGDDDDGGRLHFMVVDDTSADRRSIMQMLECEGQIVSEAVDGMDCLQMYEESIKKGEIIDVIIMDSEMPYLSGKKAANMLRTKGYTGAIFGLLDEGTQLLDEETRSLIAHGVDAVLMKPLNLDSLHAEYVSWVASRNEDDGSGLPPPSGPPVAIES